MSIERQQNRINRLFLRFSAMYGHVWRSIYKTDEFLEYTKKAWLEGLKDFEDKNIEHALHICLKTCLFPPTFPQFIENCKAYHKPEVIVHAKEPRQRANPVVVMNELEKIRVMLNIKPQ